jgi:hypothetical protein
MSKFKTTSVFLYVETASDTDDFGRPTYTSEQKEVTGVLVGEPSTDEINEVLQVHGKRLAYVIALPKGDTNDWIDKDVTVFGRKMRTIGEPTQGIEENIPLDWNKKVKVVVNE